MTITFNNKRKAIYETSLEEGKFAINHFIFNIQDGRS